MTVIEYGTGIGLIVGWGVVAVLAGRSMWLVSRGYLVALQLANAANAVLMMIRVGHPAAMAAVAAVHLGFMYILYYKYVMEEPLTALVYPRELEERCRKRPAGCLRAMLWLPYVLFAGVIVLSLAIYVWPGVE